MQGAAILDFEDFQLSHSEIHRQEASSWNFDFPVQMERTIIPVKHQKHQKHLILYFHNATQQHLLLEPRLVKVSL